MDGDGKAGEPKKSSISKRKTLQQPGFWTDNKEKVIHAHNRCGRGVDMGMVFSALLGALVRGWQRQVQPISGRRRWPGHVGYLRPASRKDTQRALLLTRLGMSCLLQPCITHFVWPQACYLERAGHASRLPTARFAGWGIAQPPSRTSRGFGAQGKGFFRLPTIDTNGLLLV